MTKRYALLINPFYPKDPHASFGKHVLTPTLALTSFAATTPDALGGRVLGRESARRAAAFSTDAGGGRDHRPSDVRTPAFELARLVPRVAGARWCSADCMCCRVPRSARRTLTRSLWATECSSGRASWRDVEAGCLQPRTWRPMRTTTARTPRRGDRPAAQELPDHDQPDCHARLPQPVRLLLSGDGWLAHAVPDAGSAARSPPSSRRTASLMACSSTTISARTASICAALCRALRPLNKIWSAAVSIDVTDDPL